MILETKMGVEMKTSELGIMKKNLLRYNCLFTIAFECICTKEDGSDITPERLFASIERRLENLKASPNDILEACGPPCDVFEEEIHETV
jgi:hypothetical protein